MTAPRLVGTLPSGAEAWQRGRVMFVLPAIPDDASPELKNALDRRRRAMLTGRCSCGAILTLSRSQVQMQHRRSCPASDETIAVLVTDAPTRSSRTPTTADETTTGSDEQ